MNNNELPANNHDQDKAQTFKQNLKLSRWSETSLTPVVPTPPLPQTSNEPSIVSLPDLAALTEAKRKQYLSKPASPILKNRLDFLTQDRQKSDRLIQQIRVSHPDNSEHDCYELAIKRLERGYV